MKIKDRKAEVEMLTRAEQATFDLACRLLRDMTRAAITGDSVATCRCGWQRVAPWTHAGRQAQEDEVHDHWRAIVAKETT